MLWLIKSRKMKHLQSKKKKHKKQKTLLWSLCTSHFFFFFILASRYFSLLLLSIGHLFVPWASPLIHIRLKDLQI